MENKTITIKKIPLTNFIDILVDLFNHGVDFIDIEGAQGDNRDYMAVTFNQDYMSKESVEYFDDVPNTITEEDITNHKLSDEDLNDLI